MAGALPSLGSSRHGTTQSLQKEGITGEHVDMLRGVLEQESGSFAIDLKNVVLVDREAVTLLAFSEAHGTELRKCAPYIREWVTRERAETHGCPSEQEPKGSENIEDA